MCKLRKKRTFTGFKSHGNFHCLALKMKKRFEKTKTYGNLCTRFFQYTYLLSLLEQIECKYLKL